MKRFRMKGRRAWRVLPGVIALTILAGALLAPTVSTAAAFLTKKKGDKRYLQNTTVVKNTTSAAASGDPGYIVTVTATCPPGYQAVGGGVESPGFLTSTNPQGMVLIENKPMPTGPKPTSWEVEAANIGPAPMPITAVAVCSK